MVPSSLTTSTSTPGRGQPGQPGQVDRRLGVPAAAPARRPRGSAAGRRGPGRVISHGSVAESASTRTVWARSAAEMPVVTPSRASTEIVYAVRSRSLLCGVISGISSRSSIVGRHRHADHAAGVADREGHQLRRRLAGGEDDVALVLAVLVVDDDDGLAGGDVGDGALDAVEPDRRRRFAHGCSPRAWSVRRPSSRSTYLASTSTSRLTRSPGCAEAEGGAGQRLGDQADRERCRRAGRRRRSG